MNDVLTSSPPAAGPGWTARARRTRPAARGWQRIALVAAALIVLFMGFVLPLALLAPQSLNDGDGFSPAAYAKFFTHHLYLDIIVSTAKIAGWTAVLSVLVGYPYALWVNRLGPRMRVIAVIAVVLPFWVSILVRTYSWTIVLGKQGLVNEALAKIGLIDQPLELLYTDTGVLIGTVNILAPFFILPMIATMRAIDDRLVLAARSLGATPFQAFWRVYFPMTVPTLVSSAFLVFVLGFGFYVTPAILGGGRVQMLATLLAYLVNTSPDWALAAAISVLLLATTALVGIVSKLVRKDSW